MANNIQPSATQRPSQFLPAGRIPLVGQIQVVSRPSPAFFLLKIENNNLDLCKREPVAKTVKSSFSPISSKPLRSSFGGRRGLHMRRARSITRRRRLRELLRLFKERLWRRYTAMLLRKQYEIINRRRFSSRQRAQAAARENAKAIQTRPKEEPRQDFYRPAA